MPEKRYYALKVTRENLDILSQANAGLRPHVEKKTTYFITPGDPNESNVILDEAAFRRYYEFVEPEREHEFTLVREIH